MFIDLPVQGADLWQQDTSTQLKDGVINGRWPKQRPSIFSQINKENLKYLMFPIGDLLSKSKRVSIEQLE